MCASIHMYSLYLTSSQRSLWYEKDNSDYRVFRVGVLIEAISDTSDAQSQLNFEGC